MRALWFALLLPSCGARVAPDDVSDAQIDTPADTATVRDSAIDSAIPDTHVVDTAPVEACPRNEPLSGGACPIVSASCAWNSVCGGVDRGVCTASGWSIERGVCPPPTKGCPATRPPKDSPCPRSSEVCLYGNACGAVVAATCATTGWSVTEFACKEGCPAAAPAIGSACKLTTDVKTCDYTFGPTCSFSCLCYLDRWTCYGTPCSDPPVGSGLGDAG